MTNLREWHVAPHVQFQEYMHLIEEVYRSADTQNPKTLRITGVAGVGKSFLLKKFIQLRPRKHDENGIFVPALLVSIPARPTEKTLLSELLRVLGDAEPTWGTAAQMRRRLIINLKSAKTKIILVDEVQHFVRHMHRGTQIAECADGFKSLINDFHGGLVMVGARSSRQLFIQNSQLRSRMPVEVEMLPFKWEDEASRLMFCSMLKAQFPLGSRDDSILLTTDFACRIWYATDGLSRAICKFVLELKSQTKPGEDINLWMLSRVFKQSIWLSAPETRNPFTKEFSWTRLNFPNEPYQADPLEGDNHVG